MRAWVPAMANPPTHAGFVPAWVRGLPGRASHGQPGHPCIFLCLLGCEVWPNLAPSNPHAHAEIGSPIGCARVLAMTNPPNPASFLPARLRGLWICEALADPCRPSHFSKMRGSVCVREALADPHTFRTCEGWRGCARPSQTLANPRALERCEGRRGCARPSQTLADPRR